MIPFSDEEMYEPVKVCLDRVEPKLALDGGGIALVEIKNGDVFVRFKGACVGCSSKNSTLEYIIQKEIRENIHPEINVFNVE
jgi:Fe-S cluster biogenesis protein NfuA